MQEAQGSSLLRIAARASRRRVEAAATKGARRAGYELRRSHYYLPFPHVEELPADLWPGPHPMPGVEVDMDAAERLLRELAPYIAESAPRREDNPGYLNNGGYESVDAETLYGLLHHLKPARIMELGSGSSSHVIEAARRTMGTTTSHTIYDPFPSGSPLGPVREAEIVAAPAQSLTPDLVRELQAGDVLFVDTTHTVKTGGDVNHILLQLVPAVAPGVWVHFHDIFLPYEYPREWVTVWRHAWAEQYLLQAFLAFNQDFEVMLPNYALTRERPGVVREVIPSFGPGVEPGAFWIRRTDKGD